MGFMKCPKCGEEVSDLAERCPRCQYMFESDKPVAACVRWSQRQEELKKKNGGKYPELPAQMKKQQDTAVKCGAIFAIGVVVAYVIKMLIL
ncbi:MAG: hypothetical protein MR867_09060 [Eubacterium sp.]|nr:hypothetical protein [Eubacterium sp.]MDD7210281.1 hypothetical protein [Lachnospiraceae bacterium]MDY5498399.1 hypothetical protein [Anaerobutyricum sp.]